MILSKLIIFFQKYRLDKPTEIFPIIYIQSIIMKNQKLYEVIDHLVTTKQVPKKNKYNFVHEYCTEQLHRKKLVKRSRRYRFEQLTKNFKNVETFVTADELLSCVNNVYREEQINKKENTINGTSVIQYPIHKRYNSAGSHSRILEQAKTALKKYHQHMYSLQSNGITPLIQQLEKNTNYFCEAIQNRQKDTIYRNFENTEKRNNQKIRHGIGFSTNQSWNYYTNTKNMTKTQPNEQNTSIRQQNKTILVHNQNKKKKKLFNLAQIYLHLILEEKHRKKWNKNNNVSYQEKYTISYRNKNKWGFEKRIKSNIATQPNKTSELFLNIIQPQQTNQQPSLTQAQPPSNQVAPKIIPSKPKTMKRMSDFLQELEQDQTNLQKDTNLQGWHINQQVKY